MKVSDYCCGGAQDRPVDLITKLIDGKVRAWIQGTLQEELGGILDKVNVLFRVIQVLGALEHDVCCV